MSDLLLLFVVVLAVNLLPAFGPPTWSVLVIFILNKHLPTMAVVLTGASAAAVGRYLLARAFRLASSHLSERSRHNLLAARHMIERSRGKTALALGLFALSPLPSAQLFEAAGLLRIRLLAFTGAFFAGRLVSYLIYASTAAKIRETSIGDVFRAELGQPLGIALQITLIGLLFGLTRLNWTKWFAGSAPRMRKEPRSVEAHVLPSLASRDLAATDGKLPDLCSAPAHRHGDEEAAGVGVE